MHRDSATSRKDIAEEIQKRSSSYYQSRSALNQKTEIQLEELVEDDSDEDENKEKDSEAKEDSEKQEEEQGP